VNVSEGSILSAEAGGSWLKTLRLSVSSLWTRGNDDPFSIISYIKGAHTPKEHSQKLCSGLRESFFSFMGL
jgi:hypothetical protein